LPSARYPTSAIPTSPVSRPGTPPSTTSSYYPFQYDMRTPGLPSGPMPNAPRGALAADSPSSPVNLPYDASPTNTDAPRTAPATGSSGLFSVYAPPNLVPDLPTAEIPNLPSPYGYPTSSAGLRTAPATGSSGVFSVYAHPYPHALPSADVPKLPSAGLAYLKTLPNGQVDSSLPYTYSNGWPSEQTPTPSQYSFRQSLPAGKASPSISAAGGRASARPSSMDTADDISIYMMYGDRFSVAPSVAPSVRPSQPPSAFPAGGSSSNASKVAQSYVQSHRPVSKALPSLPPV
jgi:hypothetical protein